MSRIIKGGGPPKEHGSELGVRRLIKHQVATAHEEAERILLDAKTQAEQILSESRASAALLEDQAQARGYEKGNLEWTERILELTAARARLIEDSRRQLLELSVKLARKILGTELQTRPEALGDMVIKALRGLPHHDKVQIRVRPSDLEILRAQQSRLAAVIATGVEIELLEDPTIEQGGCVIETPVGIVDARLETQLRVLERLLLDGKK